jgi:starvation-inducible DNA-binding protein
MKKTLPIFQALEMVKDNPELTATLNDMVVEGQDTVVVEFDEEGMQILSITKDAPSSASVHVDGTDWSKKPKITAFSSVTKAVDEEERYTLSPWYVPDSLDAHGEWTDRKEVQQAFWKYLAQDNRDIRLQHNMDIVAGQWVEGCTYPWELTVPVKHPEGDTEYTFPAGTPYLGIVWQPWAWELIKKGDIRGLSIGGTANRYDSELEKSDDDPLGNVSFTKMIRHEDGKFELYSHDGKRHLGSFDSEEAAKNREAEINRIKHMQKSAPFVLPKDFIDSLNIAKHAAYITEPTREGLAAELCELLGEVVAFRFIAQGFHWNVMGINFQQFHDLFQEIYEDADSSIDSLGESIRKLNYDAPFRLSDFMSGVASMEIPETNDPSLMSQVLYVANEQVRSCIMKAFTLADCMEEQGIANFLAERLDMHSKWQWQLRAVVGDAFADAYEIDVASFGSMLSTNIDNHMHTEVENSAMYKAIKVGSMVSWNSSGGTARGKIERIIRDGKYDVPDSNVSVTGTEDDPAAVIRVYRNDEPTDTIVAHKLATLSE